MHPMSCDQFNELHARLAARFPEDIGKAQSLAASTVDPRTATAEAIWGVLWDKPLYANARVAVAERWVASIAPEMPGAWQTWGADAAVFCIHQDEPGVVKRANFKVLGGQAVDFVARHSMALHRLHRIQGAAIALRKRAAASPLPFADLVGRPLAEVVSTLQHEFGPGWGPITVLHALTDMGLAAKPDIHVVRTMRFLQLCPGLSDRKVPSFREAIQINQEVRNLLKALGRPDTAAELRYLDKVLMDISRRELLS